MPVLRYDDDDTRPHDPAGNRTLPRSPVTDVVHTLRSFRIFYFAFRARRLSPFYGHRLPTNLQPPRVPSSREQTDGTNVHFTLDAPHIRTFVFTTGRKRPLTMASKIEWNEVVRDVVVHTERLSRYIINAERPLNLSTVNGPFSSRFDKSYRNPSR